MCLFEHCLGPKTFSSSGDWARHMTSEHDNNWALNIHESPVWRCDRIGGSHEEMLHFRTLEKLENHIRTDHNLDKNPPTGEEMISSNPLVACPFCYMTLPSEDASRSQPAATEASDDSGSPFKEKQEAANIRAKVRFAEDVKDVVQEEIREQPVQHQTPPDDMYLNINKALSSHIAEHLQRLALLALRLNVDADGNDDQTEFDSDNPAADESISASATSTVKVLMNETEEVLANEIAWDSDNVSPELSLRKRLLDSTIESAHPRGQTFLPNDAIDGIVAPENIEAYISMSEHDVLWSRCSDIIDFVCGNSELNASKIFAALLLMDQAPLIVDFMEEKISDLDLPIFWSDKGENGSTRMSKKVGNTFMPIAKFDQWTSAVQRSFFSVQWLVKAPVFEENNSESWDSHPAMRLSEAEVLPWTQFSVVSEPGDSHEIAHVKIHDAHHTFQPKVMKAHYKVNNASS